MGGLTRPPFFMLFYGDIFSMSHSKALETITQLVAPLAMAQGLELWGVEVVGTTRPITRIYIDTTKTHTFSNETHTTPNDTTGVTIDQCAKLSRLIGLTIEVEEIFTHQWTLEISSPGLERPFFTIEQLKPYINHELEVTLKYPHELWPGRKNFHGRLTHVIDKTFTLSLSLDQRKPSEPDTVHITWQQVHKAKLTPNLPKPNKKSGTLKGLGGGPA